MVPIDVLRVQTEIVKRAQQASPAKRHRQTAAFFGVVEHVLVCTAGAAEECIGSVVCYVLGLLRSVGEDNVAVCSAAVYLDHDGRGRSPRTA